MKRRTLKPPRGGIALATTLMVLFILAVIGFAICAISISNLSLVSGYRSTSMAYYAARAGIAEAFYRIDSDNAYGTSSNDSFTETLSNTQSFRVNFVSGPYYSVNNIAGSGNVHDGAGDNIPSRFVSVISSSTVRGCTVRLKAIGRLGIPGDDYAVFTDDFANASTVVGDIRNNYTGTGTGMSFTSLSGTATTMAGPGSISVQNGSGTLVYNAQRYSVPDLQVANLVSAASSRPGINVFTPATLPTTLDGATYPYSYVNGDVNLNELTIRNGATLFINGTFTGRLALALNTVASRNAIFSAGDFTVNGSSGTDSCSILTAGSIRFNGAATLRGFLYCNGFYDQNGTSDYRGNIMVRNGGLNAAGTDVTYDPQYMEALGHFFPPELVRFRLLTMGQI